MTTNIVRTLVDSTTFNCMDSSCTFEQLKEFVEKAKQYYTNDNIVRIMDSQIIVTKRKTIVND